MVYCGKPSSSCQACREKKTRCDRKTPSCTQCIRAKRTCPGYRNQLDLMFRNESETVINKVKAREKSKEKTRANSSESSSSSSEGVSSRSVTPFTVRKSTPELTMSSAPSPMSDSSPQLPRSSYPDVDHQELQQNVVEFALRYPEGQQGGLPVSYLPSYCLPPTLEERSRGYFYTHASTYLSNSDLLDQFCSQTNRDAYLLASMSAVGLAGLSNSVGAPELMVRARKDYVTALRLTNAALQSPAHVKKDSTLFSVMILSLYETISGTDTDSLAAWTKHINGATALVKLRGIDQFKTDAGQRMFLQILSRLMISCIQRTIPMPDHIVKLRSKAATYLDANQPAWKLSGIIIDFTIFRAKVRSCEITEPRKIVDQGLELDRRFRENAANLPAEYVYRTIYTTERPDLVWDGYYHKYNSHWAAQMWNGLRVCRIITHQTIRDQMLVGTTASEPVFSEEQFATQDTASIELLLQLQADILASVPQHFAEPLGNQAPDLIDESRGFYILWPLYLVGVMDMITLELRTWVANRLEAIAEEVGILQAKVLAEFIRSGREVDEWNMKPDLLRSMATPLVQKMMEKDLGEVLWEI